MTAFSLGTVWEETIAFLRRESGLMIPVALAIYGPAQLMMDFGLQKAYALRANADAANSWQALLVLPGGLLMLLGNLVVTLLVMVPGISVGEALSGGIRRLPTAIGAMFLVFTAVMAAALAIMVAASFGSLLFGADPRSPVLVSQLFVLILIPAGVVWLRLLLLPTVTAVEPLGPAAAIRRAWDLARGNMLRFLGVWVILLFLSILLAMVEMFVVGSVAELLKRVTGELVLPMMLQSIANAAIGALLSMGLAVYLALVYRTLTAR